MDSSPEQPPVDRMARLRPPRQWLVLLAFSLLFASALEAAALPAALLI
ncbi:MAG: AbrB family transcriptional regulator, partial [Mesorhizobium sp.]